MHLKSDLIRVVALGGSDLIREVAFGECGLIREVAFGESGLIREVAPKTKLQAKKNQPKLVFFEKHQEN